MKKIVVIVICITIIILSTTIGYLLVSANTEVKQEANLIKLQNENQKDYKSYGYTIDNPNIIINPYDISPLTALIIFETEKEEQIKITIEGKDDKTTYHNTFASSKTHYIPVYGLYPDSENKVIIESKDTKEEYIIKTPSLPTDLINIETNDTDKLLFITTDNYTYAIDSNNDIRWYLTKEYSKKISRLSNGNFLLSTDKKNENNSNTGLIEIDLLGKIYKEYKINTGYYGSYTELENSILVLSKDILEIDKQTGAILSTISLDSTYEKIDYKNNIIYLMNEYQTTLIDTITNEQNNLDNINIEEENTLIDTFYINDNQYKIIRGISFDNHNKTKTSTKNIMLINYKKTDTEYDKYNIEIKQETDRLTISGEFNQTDKIYIILEKFLDKKVYEVKVDESITYKYINREDLEGKYSIYIKINDNLYKTNKYVNF